MRKHVVLLLIACIAYTAIFAQPVIESFLPASGPVGTSVTIKGSGFSAIANNNIVYFGAVKAVVTNATETTITATVPDGTTYQPITVTTSNLTAYSYQSFLVTNEANITGPFTSTSFLPKQDITTGMYPHGLAIADFNLDRKPDLLVSKGSSASISVLTNTTMGGNISFGSPLELSAMGNNHEGAAIGDLDGDGRLDIVVTNSTLINSISVFGNTTIGASISFTPKIDLDVLSGPYDVAIGDLDKDGKPDLVIANNGANAISVYKNKSVPGLLSFTERVDIAAGTNPYSVEIADLDADGKLDIICTNQGSSSGVTILKNSSTGGTISFDPPVMPTNLSVPMHVAVGDIDGDTKPDLIAVSIVGSAMIVKRNISTPGILSFTGQIYTFTAADYPEGVAISDLNGDGKPDVVVSNRNSHTISAFQNTSTIGAVSFASQVQYAVGQHPIFVASGDLDGDSRPDIIAANSSATQISILKNIIGANIAPVIKAFTPTTGINGTPVTITGENFIGTTAVKFGGVDAASFTVNSATSITTLVGQGASGDVSVTTPTGTATLNGFVFNGPIINSFTPTIGVTGTVVTIIGTNFTGATAVHFGGIPATSFTVNSATNITAVVGNGASGNVTITTSTGTATLAGFGYGAPTITDFTPLSAPAGTIINITGTNFSTTPTDNTVFFGTVKATVTTSSATELKVVVPAGSSYAPISVTTNHLTAYSSLPFSTRFVADNPKLSTSSFSNVGNYSTGSYPVSIAFADLNNDGKTDMITTNALGNNISILKNTSTKFNIQFENKIDLTVGSNPRRVAVGDLDGDGNLDLAVINFNGGLESTLSIFRNTTTGNAITFSQKMDISTGNGSLGLGIADIDGDGKPDLVVTSGNSGFISIFRNTTVGTSISFASKQDIALLLHPDNMFLADLDKDGRTDIITSNFSDANISIYRNTSLGGALSLAPRLDYAVGIHPGDLSVGDLDGDGKLDLLVKTTGQLSYLKNNSQSGSISLASVKPFASNATNIAIADLNGDGKIDLSTGQAGNGTISVFENATIAANLNLEPAIDFTTSSFDTFVGIMDIDGDGKPDLAAANTSTYTVTILRNTIGDPIITVVSAPMARKNELINITGTNFTGATAVAFGGTPAASFTIVSPERIEAMVGSGASGNITVTTPTGIASFPGFKFIPEVTANGPTMFCSNNAVTLTSSAATNNQWLRDGVAIVNATGASYQPTSSGTYSVRTTSNGITTTSATGIAVNVTAVLTPTMTLSGLTFTSSAATGNQWYLNGVLIPGATAQTYYATETGSYTVQMTANGCTSNMSAAYNLIVTSVINLDNNQFVKLFPNPIKKELNIQWSLNNTNVIRLEVCDINGHVVLAFRDIRSAKTLNLSTLATGTYFIKIYGAPQKPIGTIKVLKVN